MAASCLHLCLLQTLEKVWENSKVLMKALACGSDLLKLWNSPKLSLVFASGYMQKRVPFSWIERRHCNTTLLTSDSHVLLITTITLNH